MSRRSYDGPALDGTVQYITERPAALGDDDSGETVEATPDPDGEVTTENVPDFGPGPESPATTPDRPAATGQTTWGDWEGSA